MGFFVDMKREVRCINNIFWFGFFVGKRKKDENSFCGWIFVYSLCV